MKLVIGGVYTTDQIITVGEVTKGQSFRTATGHWHINGLLQGSALPSPTPKPLLWISYPFLIDLGQLNSVEVRGGPET